MPEIGLPALRLSRFASCHFGWLAVDARKSFLRNGSLQRCSRRVARIVHDAIVRYPLLQIEAAAKNAFEQFIHFGTGDQIEPQQWVLSPVLTQFIPSQMAAYYAAHQQRGEIRFHDISDLDIAVGTISLVGTFLLLGWSICTRQFSAATFQGFVLAALIGNALICGTLSGPHDRYQSRLIWLGCFAVMITNPAIQRACGAAANPALRTM